MVEKQWHYYSQYFSSVFSATAFGGATLVFSMLTDHVAKELKRHDLALEKLQRVRDKWNENQMKRLDFINKRLREKNEARTYINNVDESMLEYYRVFSKKIKPYPIFTIHLRPPKMANYYLLQLVQVLQHMPYTNTLNR